MGRADLMIMCGDTSSDGEFDDDDDSQTDQTSDENHLADIFENIDLYLSAKNGNVDGFRRVLDQISATENASHVEILSRVSPAGNTLLHIAVKHGNQEIVTFIAEKDPYAILDKNFRGDAALHLASEVGDESMVRTLMLILRELQEIPCASDIADAGNDLVMAKNKRGNTALLEALNNGREAVAKYWIQEIPDLSYIQNKKGESALYLAASAGFANCVSLILESCTDQERINQQFKNMSPIRAAIMMQNRDILEAMLSRKPDLMKLKDGEGRTPLHYAVSLGHLEDVRYLLDKYAPGATQTDNNGFCPIHLASIKGCVDIISLLLEYCPAPGELLDNYGCTILHLAAKNGRHNLVKYILNNPDFEVLINMKDDYGNTPLHLATMGWHPKTISALTWDKRVDVKLVNDIGRTALDVAENNMLQNPSFRQRLTWAALKAAGTPRSLSGQTLKRRTPGRSYFMDSCKERVNTLLLVSTLVATITFAAGFTMPGGYNSSAMDLGMATLLRQRLFHIFVLCDTIAMHCSIVVAVALIFAQLGDLNLVLTALNLALPLLGVALSMMSMAFTAGISLVVGKLRWLSITVLITGFTFLAILLLLFVPLCSPITSSNRILRYLSYYSFCFLMLATKSYD